MALLLFPKLRLKKWHDIDAINFLSAAPKAKKRKNKINRDLVAARENVAKATDHYDEQIKNLGFVRSFIPTTPESKVRKELNIALDDYTAAIEKQFHTNKNEKKLAKYFPSSWKVLILSAIAIMMIAIAFTGIGALIQAGVFGAAIVSTVIGQALMALSSTALLTGISLNAWVAITAVSSYFALSALGELVKPGKYLRLFVWKNSKITLLQPKKTLEHIKSAFKPWQIYAAAKANGEGPWQVGSKVTFEVFKLLINPPAIAILMVKTLSHLGCRLVDIGCKDPGNQEIRNSTARVVAKSVIHLLAEIIMAPLYVLKAVFNIPVNIVSRITQSLIKSRTHQGDANFLSASVDLPKEDPEPNRVEVAISDANDHVNSDNEKIPSQLESANADRIQALEAQIKKLENENAGLKQQLSQQDDDHQQALADAKEQHTKQLQMLLPRLAMLQDSLLLTQDCVYEFKRDKTTTANMLAALDSPTPRQISESSSTPITYSKPLSDESSSRRTSTEDAVSQTQTQTMAMPI